MTRRQLGISMIIAGVVISLIGIVGTVADRGSNPEVRAAEQAAPTSTDGSDTTTSTAPVTSDSPTAPQPPATVVTTLVTVPTSSTTSPAATTTLSISSADRVVAFVDSFAAAITDGDVDELMATLHPVVIVSYGSDLCRAFIEREILALSEYELIGRVTGPVTKTLETPSGPVSIDNIYEVEIRFVFGGQTFEATADFVVDESETWVATCR